MARDIADYPKLVTYFCAISEYKRPKNKNLSWKMEFREYINVCFQWQTLT